jgi:O-methyltransferase involved in polyketide biosynthesis
MRSGQRSLTALGVAAVRAVHQAVDGGRVFVDPLAARLVDADRSSGSASFRTHAPCDLALRMRERGLSVIEDIAYEALAARYESGMSQPPGGGGHIVHARA